MNMNLSIIVPCFNEERNIADCLNSLIRQDYQLGNYEIIVVDGGSKDKTETIVIELQKDCNIINLVVETQKGVAAGRNAGIKVAQYDYIALIDADCEAPVDWLTILVENYTRGLEEDKQIVAVGGGNLPPEDSSGFLKAIGIALDSYVGSFNSAQGRQFKSRKYVPSLANLNVLYDKSRLAKVGYYDESLLSEAEDADLNYRLSKLGYKFLFIPESYVWHKMRPTPQTWLKNMFRYGKGRARLLKRYPDMWRINFVLPIVFILTMASLILLPISKIFLTPLSYFLFIIGLSFSISYRKGATSIAFYVMIVYMIKHFGYACGEVYGLLNPKVK